MSPLAINNFVQGRLLLGAVSFAIVGIFFFTAWSIHFRQKFYPALILFGLIPAILYFLVISLLNQGFIGVLWCYPAVVVFYFILPERMAWLANTIMLLITLPLCWMLFDHSLTIRITATLILVSTLTAIFTNVITRQSEKLQRQAVTDPLTGALNRTLLDDVMSQAVAQSRRSNLPMSVVLLDLDGFKFINDKHGHEAGDQVLQAVTNILQSRCRAVDRLFRMGGEEFMLFLYNTSREGGLTIANELCRNIEAANLLEGHPVTISGGIATLLPDEGWQEMMIRGDKCLYEAKTAGRNKIVG